MRLVHELDVCVSDRQLFLRNPPVDHRRVETGACERVAETASQRVKHIGSSVKGHRSVALRNRPKLIDAVAMVGVIMGNDNGIHFSDTGSQKLRPDVRPTIDEEPFSIAFQQQAAAQTAISRLIWIAFAPVGSDPGDTGRRAAAEDRQFQLGLALPNKR